jgi:nucleoside phosphorylase
MRTALALQALLARLPPDAVLTAGPAGGFPLSVEEMRWQLDFLGRVEQ